MPRGVPYKTTHYKIWCFQCLRYIFDGDTKRIAEKAMQYRHPEHIREIRRTLEPGRAKGDLLE